MKPENENKIFAVIDTNVLVSALIATKVESYPLIVVAYVFTGVITPVFNDEILAEYQEVLSRNKFNLNQQDIEQTMSFFKSVGVNVQRTETTDEVFTDAKDIVFYEVKLSKSDSYLVTGNKKHFPQKPFVITPKEMVEICIALKNS